MGITGKKQENKPEWMAVPVGFRAGNLVLGVPYCTVILPAVPIASPVCSGLTFRDTSESGIIQENIRSSKSIRDYYNRYHT